MMPEWFTLWVGPILLTAMLVVFLVFAVAVMVYLIRDGRKE